MTWGHTLGFFVWLAVWGILYFFLDTALQYIQARSDKPQHLLGKTLRISLATFALLFLMHYLDWGSLPLMAVIIIVTGIICWLGYQPISQFLAGQALHTTQTLEPGLQLSFGELQGDIIAVNHFFCIIKQRKQQHFIPLELLLKQGFSLKSKD